jgi:hypothetical protein
MKNPEADERPFCVIEGPNFGDAKFYAKWLAAVADADMLWKKALKQRKFWQQVDFRILGSVLLFSFANYGTMMSPQCSIFGVTTTAGP